MTLTAPPPPAATATAPLCSSDGLVQLSVLQDKKTIREEEGIEGVGCGICTF